MNYCDVNDWLITSDDLKQYADWVGALVVETSSLSYTNISFVVDIIWAQIITNEEMSTKATKISTKIASC